jgi:hypothetical protein
VLFSAVVAFIVLLPIAFGDSYLPQSQSPWQLQPFNADSLSAFYKANYGVYEEPALHDYLDDTARTTMEVLVDGWGVPYDENLLVQDFANFDGSARFAVHRRMFNYTAFAEGHELQRDSAEGLFIYGGDSLACAKKRSHPGASFAEVECCVGCGDSRMLAVLDSLLADCTWKRLAWTTRQTREGDRDSLGLVLRGLAEISKRRPDVQFIIQGTHRPILGTPETRRKYLSPWVPAVFVNAVFKEK